MASLQGLEKFHEIADKQQKNDGCCEDLEHMILKLKEDVNDEKKDQDCIESRQRGLCNLVSIVMFSNYWCSIVLFHKYN